jgi:hypothetical protein
MELNLPHLIPVRFAKYIISKDETSALVRAEFNSFPSLAMLVEAAAQSSGAFSDAKKKMGVLVKLKNIKLLSNPNAVEYDIKVILEHQVDALVYFNFEVFDNDIPVATGTFIISM